MDMDLITNILFAMVRTGTPLLLVALGELVCEKSGVLNLGQEGMMLMGAVIGFIAAITTGSLIFGVIMSLVVGMAMALLFGLLAIQLRANQVATGLALTIFGAGLSAYVGTGLHWSGTGRISARFDSAFIRHTGSGQSPVQSGCSGLLLAGYRTGYLAVLPLQPPRPCSESHRGKPTLCHSRRLTSHTNALAGATVWWCHGWPRGSLSVIGLYAAVGRRHDRRTRLDCTGTCRICQLESRTGITGGLVVWFGKHYASGTSGHGSLHLLQPAGNLALRGNDYCSGPSIK